MALPGLIIDPHKVQEAPNPWFQVRTLNELSFIHKTKKFTGQNKTNRKETTQMFNPASTRTQVSTRLLHLATACAFMAALAFQSVPASAQTTPLASCPPKGAFAASIGTMVEKRYTTAAMCLTSNVDSSGTLEVVGFSVDTQNDGVCVSSELIYRTGSKNSSVSFPLNCSNPRLAFSRPAIPGVSFAALRVCLSRPGSPSPVQCSSPAQFFPPPPPSKNPFGPR